jgi:hypothetical protein
MALRGSVALYEVSPSIGVDDEICLDSGSRRLDHDMDAPGVAVATFSIADDPAHSIAGGKWSRTG